MFTSIGEDGSMVRKKRNKPITAAERQMGARFKEVRLALRPDIATPQMFGDALEPKVTAQTVRNWESGRPIPLRMMRAICKFLDCDPKIFFDPPGAPIIKHVEHVERLRSDAQMGLTYEIAAALEASNGAEIIEGWAQKYQALGDHETAEYIRSEASRMAKVDEQELAEQVARDRRLMLLAVPLSHFPPEIQNSFLDSMNQTIEHLGKSLETDEVYRTRSILITLMHALNSDGWREDDADDWAERLADRAEDAGDGETADRIRSCLELMNANILPGWKESTPVVVGRVRQKP